MLGSSPTIREKSAGPTFETESQDPGEHPGPIQHRYLHTGVVLRWEWWCWGF
jgi:hypothetical protein